jgi:hypothetical protein
MSSDSTFPRPDPADVARRLDGYFASLQQAFDAAADRGGRTDVLLEMAGRRLRLRLAGGATAAFVLPALVHAARDDDAAVDHEVLVWDAASTGVSLPPPPWNWPPAGAHVQVVLPAGGEAYRIPGSRPVDSFAMLSIASRRTIVWLADAAAVPWAARAAPLMQVWRWWAAANGLRILHAGCVGTAAGAALVVGRGGSGKSSTAVLAALAGLHFVSDDYCLLGDGPEPVAHALFGTAKVHVEHLRRFPELSPAAVIRPVEAGEKAILLMEHAAPGRVAASLPLRSVLAARVTGASRPRLVPISAAEALRAVAPSTLMQLYRDDGAACGDLAALVRRLPCWRLELGGGLDAVPDLLRQHLASLPSPSGRRAE